MKDLKANKTVFFACIIGMTINFISGAEASRLGTTGTNDTFHPRTGVCKTLPVSYDTSGQKVYGRMIAIGYDFTREECVKDSTAKFENFWTAGD